MPTRLTTLKGFANQGCGWPHSHPSLVLPDRSLPLAHTGQHSSQGKGRLRSPGLAQAEWRCAGGKTAQQRDQQHGHATGRGVTAQGYCFRAA